MAIGGGKRIEQPSKVESTSIWKSSKELPFWSAFRMSILGPPAHGKTHLCLTASAKVETGVLDDIAIVQTDPLGLAMVEEMGLEVPHVLDMTTDDDATMNRKFTTLPKQLTEKALSTPGLRAICIDTASVLFGAVGTMEVKAKEGGKDGALAYNEFARRVKEFYSKLKMIPCPIITTFHIKSPQIKVNNADYQTAVAMAAGLGEGALTFDIEGKKTAQVIRGMNLFTAWLQLKELPGGKEERSLLFKSKQYDTKQRLTRCVGKEEPADLSALFKKIAEGCSKPLPGETK